MQFRFADYMLDTKRRELRRGSEPIAVEPQVFDLLVYLVQNRERPISYFASRSSTLSDFARRVCWPLYEDRKE
jgi:DNA-binding response OmpR family regulator